MTSFDGYISLYPAYSRLADNRGTSTLNPKKYFKQYQIEVKEREPMQRIYVESPDRSGGCWGDRIVEEIKDYFPPALPARLLLEGKQDQVITLIVKGHPFRLLCKQSGQRPFEEELQHLLTQVEDWPEEHEFTFSPQDFSLSSFQAVLKKNDPLVTKLFLDSNAKVLNCTHAELKEIYRNIKRIGGGYEGSVYAVAVQKTGEQRALKIASHPLTSINREVLSVIYHLLDTDQTPHLTRNYRYLTLESKSVDLSPKKEGDFINDSGGKHFSVFEMELLDGDLENVKLPEKQMAAVMVQACSALEKLAGLQTFQEDLELKNIFYKKLTPSDTFKGQALLAYDYWKYRVGGEEFYIPRQDILIKLGDYDQWGTTLFTDKVPKGTPNFLKTLCHEMSLTVDELKAIFPKPDSGTILEITV